MNRIAILKTMVKIIGSICILLGCAMMGIKASMSLREHVSILSGFISALETIESEIRCRLSPIPAAIRAAGQGLSGRRGKCSTFFNRCLSEMDRIGPHEFPSIWHAAIADELSFLPENEKQLLGELADTLGNYEAEEQAAAIGYIRKRLDIFLQAAEKERDRSGRVYMTLGVTLGIAVVIILV